MSDSEVFPVEMKDTHGGIPSLVSDSYRSHVIM
jgi:hypothetical protein